MLEVEYFGKKTLIHIFGTCFTVASFGFNIDKILKRMSEKEISVKEVNVTFKLYSKKLEPIEV